MNKPNQFQPKKEFLDPKLRRKIVKLRNENDLPWIEITRKIMEEFHLKITSPTVKKIYSKEIAKSSLVVSSNQKNMADATMTMLNKRYERVCSLVDILCAKMEKLFKRLTPEQYLKYGPLLLATSKEVINQLDFVRKEQQRINFQTTNLIYSDVQIIKVIHKHLKQYEKEGFIKILKPLSQEEKEDKEKEDKEEIKIINLYKKEIKNE